MRRRILWRMPESAQPRAQALRLVPRNKDASATLEGVRPMFANVLMLVLFYAVLVVPVLWVFSPARMVTPY